MSIEPQLIDRWRGKSTQRWTPLQASLELTNKCNERCTHCYIDKFVDDPKRVLSEDEWIKVLHELRSAGSLYLILMGGEAMLNRHFWSVLNSSVRLGFHTSMISNGLLIQKKEIAQRLKKNGIANITFSFYSLDPEIHNRMTRVKGSCEKTQNAIELCLAEGIDVTVNCLLTRENISGVFELQEWCLERNLELKVDPMVTPTLGGNNAPTMLRPSKEQLEWFYRKRSELWTLSTPKPIKELKSDYVCNAAKGKCAVTAYGELLPCIEIREPIGSLVNESFSDIWQREVAKKWRNVRVGDLKDYPLKQEGSDCDHCPGMAKNEDGDPTQVSTYARMVADVKSKIRNEVMGGQKDVPSV